MCPPAHLPSALAVRTWLWFSREWVLAGQQTAICKHHEGKHQSTLDFFYIIFCCCKHFKDRPTTPFKDGKENALSLLIEGEGKDGGQFILLSGTLSSSWESSGRREDHFLEASAEGCPVPSGVPSSALSSVRGASSQEEGLSVPLRGVSKQAQQVSQQGVLDKICSLQTTSLCSFCDRCTGKAAWLSCPPEAAPPGRSHTHPHL